MMCLRNERVLYQTGPKVVSLAITNYFMTWHFAARVIDESESKFGLEEASSTGCSAATAPFLAHPLRIGPVPLE